MSSTAQNEPSNVDTIKNDNNNDIPLSFASFYYSLKVTKGKDEREDVQKKTFTKWINSQLAKVDHPPIDDLFNDLRDGTVLLKLLALLTGKEMKGEHGNMKMHHIINLNLVLSILKEHKIRLINISSNDINDGNPKLTLGLVWNIIQHWQVRDILKSAVYDIHSTNLEKALLKWCQESTKNYSDVNIKDFTNSWKDGLAFNAIIHNYRPDLFSYDELVKKKSTHSADYFLKHAFEIAHKHLSIERLLDIEDVLTDNLDKKSIMMYVMCYFQVLSRPKTFIDQSEKLSIVNTKIDKATITPSYSLRNLHDISCQRSTESLANIIEEQKPSNELNNNKMSSEASSTEPSSDLLESYLIDLKKVIEWLINSESLLNNQTNIGDDVNTVKQQFQTHEDFMLELTKHQNNVGLVLQEGNRIINGKLVSQDDETEVKKQMKLLNDMWENLRLLAVERQAKLHEGLMKLQMEQLNQMDTWLKTAETRIENISQLADSFEGLIEQKEELSSLQDDLVKEQEAVDCLKQIIVVVDDNTDDQAFNDLESKLANLSDRWSNVCKFVGNRWFVVQDLIIKLKSINAEFDYLNEWITNKTTDLNILIVKTKALVEKNNLKIDKPINFQKEYANIESDPILTSSELIKILKEIELEMQTMHSKLNDMNEIGEQIGTQLNNSPKLSASINSKMDILELKWNTLLEQMEYLSKIGTEQQQYEIIQQVSSLTNKTAVQASKLYEADSFFSEIKISFDLNETSTEVLQFKSLIENDLNEFNFLLNIMNNLFKNCQYINELNEQSQLDDQNEAFKKCLTDLSNSKETMNRMRFITNKMSTTMKLNGLDSTEINHLMDTIENKWKENVQFIEELNSNSDKSSLERRAFEELSTLRDVFDGYNKYIQNAEALSIDDIQRLTMQLETNKVKLKGMKSYEIRLNDLRNTVNQLKNKELVNEIEKFYVKWMDTYALIKKRNEEIIRIEQKSDMISSRKNEYTYDNYISESSAQNSSQYVMRLNESNLSSGSSDSGSDENILHVVTNVYTIPITKSVSGQTKVSTLDQAESQIAKKLNEIKINLVQAKQEANDYETKRIEHRSIDLSSKINHFSTLVDRSDENVISKSKFQIKSIVEIYDSQENEHEQNKGPIGLFKTTNQINETITENQVPIIKDQRQNTETNLDSQFDRNLEQFQNTTQSLIEWLNRLKKSIDFSQVEFNFIPVLEEKYNYLQEILTELKEKKSSLDLYRQNLDTLTKSKKELSQQFESTYELILTKYKKLSTFVTQKLEQFEKSINDLKNYQNEYTKVVNDLKRIETNLQIEHHATSNSALEKTIEEQLNVLKLIKHDIDDLSIKLVALNELSKKYLMYTNSIDSKFQNKLKQELFELNESFSQVKNLFANKRYALEDILAKSTKVDSRVNEIENWIALKNNEILESDGVIITEEQFDQRSIKYKQIKSEVERKTPEVRQLIENGNEMLKNTTGGITSITELANNMSALNSNWTSLNQRIDLKIKEFTKLEGYINELRQLIYQENRWIESVQNRLNSIECGNDAEEISEMIDTLENQFKNHQNENKDRIAQLSNMLVESNILIQLNNSDVKEYIFKYQLICDEANKKMRILEESFNDIQIWEKRFLELQDWINYMEKYLSARVDNDIYADDVPADFQRVQEEFVKNEHALKELEEANGKFRHDERLVQRFTMLKTNWSNLNHKFKKFQKPADFDQKLKKVTKQLEEIEAALYMIEMNSEDSDTIHLQLEHCIKFYKSLSELKSQIEFVLKQGRTIVEKKQVDNLEELTRCLDTLKQKYNDLGSKVTSSKNDLEKGFKMAKKFKKEYNLLNDFMTKIDGELKKIEQKPLSKNYPDELDWIKNTKSEINKVSSVNLENLRSFQKSLRELIHNKKTINETNTTSVKINEIEQKVQNLKARIQDREDFLNQQAKSLDDLYDTFLAHNREVITQIEKLHHELIEAERAQSKDQLDEIERVLNQYFSEVESVRSQGTELCSKSEYYAKTVETELRTLLTNFEDLNRRLNLAQERANFQSTLQDNQSTSFTKTETIRQSRHAQESKYYRSKRSKSPSESSIDSSADVFDSELKQKYMRAVAYLRILDEIPSQENVDGQDGMNYETNERITRVQELQNLSSIDIDFVIQQARQVAEMNENSNPERSRRILEKVNKLEQRWNATKSKRNSFKSSAKLYEKYKEREGNLNDQIHILEEFSLHKLQQEDQQIDDESEYARYFYGPSDFIYEPSDFMQLNNQQVIYKQSERYQDAFDTHSVISEPAVILKEIPVCEQQPVTIRKYKTTKTTTTTHHVPPPNQAAITHINSGNMLNSQSYNQSYAQNQMQNHHMQTQVPQSYHRQATHYVHNQNLTNNARSSSIPPSLQKGQFMEQNYSRSNTQLDQSAMNYQNKMSSNSTANTFSHAPATETIRTERSLRQTNNNQAGLASNSCIDYTNSFYNSDWYARHGSSGVGGGSIRHEHSIPTELPIYLQRK